MSSKEDIQSYSKIFILYKNNYLFQPQEIDPLLRKCIGDFLRTLQDPELNVRRVALVTFNSAAHNKASLIRDLLESVLPHLYNETKVRVSNPRFLCECIHLPKN